MKIYTNRNQQRAQINKAHRGVSEFHVHSSLTSESFSSKPALGLISIISFSFLPSGGRSWQKSKWASRLYTESSTWLKKPQAAENRLQMGHNRMCKCRKAMSASLQKMHENDASVSNFLALKPGVSRVGRQQQQWHCRKASQKCGPLPGSGAPEPELANMCRKHTAEDWAVWIWMMVKRRGESVSRQWLWSSLSHTHLWHHWYLPPNTRAA